MPKDAPTLLEPLQQLAANVLALRAKGNWSTRALAEHCRIDRRTVQRLEHGELSTLSIGTLEKLARGLGVRTGSLFASKPVTHRGMGKLIEDILAENLVRARERRGWTQAALGSHSGVSMYVIAHIERQARNPTVQTVEKLALPLGTTVERLLTEQRPRS